MAVGSGVLITDGPSIEIFFGVGVGVAFVRPDCAIEVATKDARNNKQTASLIADMGRSQQSGHALFKLYV